MAASKPVDETATVDCDFPESAQWVSLVDAKDDVPTFNIQNIVSYFIERLEPLRGTYRGPVGHGIA